MNPIRLLFCFFTALVPSILGAISGIGGGIIIKPVLDAFSAFTPEEINFLSGSTVLAMSTVSLIQSRRKKMKMDDRRGIFLALGAAAGGTSGKFLFTAAVINAPGRTVTMIQSGILVFLCTAVFIYMLKKDLIKTFNIKNAAFCFFLGAGMGIISAFLGIGGGPINIMIISCFLGMDSKITGLYSIYVICLSQLASLISSAATGKIPEFSAMILAVMIIGGITGGFIGSGIRADMKIKQIDVFFRSILMGVIMLSVYQLVKLLI